MALLITLMVLIILSLLGLAALLTSTTDVQIAGNSAHSTQALYLAEAGAGQVKSWFENPGSFNPPAGSYTLDPNNSMGVYTFPQDFFKPRRVNATGAASYLNSGNLSQFTDINNSNTIDGNDANNSNDDGKTTDQNNQRTGDHPVLSITSATAAGKAYLNSLFQDLSSMGQVTVLEIYPPMLNTNFATVRVTAVDAAGAARTIEQELGPSSGLNITFGNAVSAGTNIGLAGQPGVHWGAMVAGGNVTLGTNSLRTDTPNSSCTVKYGSSCVTYDQWWSLDAKGTFAMGGGPGLTLPDPNYNITPNSTKQPQTLSSDQKAQLKQYSQDSGQYYVYCSTDSLLHKADSSGNPTGAGINFHDLTLNKTFDMLYIDIGAVSPSCNPTAPATKPTIVTSGGGTCGSCGFYTNSNIYMETNFSIAGSGTPPNITVQDPSGANQTIGVHINGFFYTTGNYTSAGNPVIYGALTAEGGFSGCGQPQVYYNSNLKNGILGGSASATTVQGWREIRK